MSFHVQKPQDIAIFFFTFMPVFNLISSFSRRFAPLIGQFKISDIATMTILLNQVYGKIVKVGGLVGRADLLFVYDADEIEKVGENLII